MVTIENLSISYPDADKSLPALDYFTAVFENGKIAAILGPSGCGKTSLLNVIAGLKKPSAGRISIDGTPIVSVGKGTAIIFQDFGLLPWKTAEANIELPLLINKVPTKERKERTRALLDEFGLKDFAHYYPVQLSGGMKQRIAISRSLVSSPSLLLMDEPFSSLDALSREDAQNFLLALHRKRPLTIIVVTHSIEEAVFLADDIFIIKGRNPGRLAAHIQNSPRAPDKSFRNSPKFQEMCGRLREIMEAPNPISTAA
ncbi:MAG: ATP-binding cassette domain-containing protein [Treponema sp.]|jgi:NitT/TauT family transport system ATP-binding protein|nr:ATP-binding cassette domain-containing protein [Treponema sp.]